MECALVNIVNLTSGITAIFSRNVLPIGIMSEMENFLCHVIYTEDEQMEIFNLYSQIPTYIIIGS